MTGTADKHNNLLTADTGPLPFDALTADQKELLSGVWNLLLAMAEDTGATNTNGRPRSEEPRSPWAPAPQVQRTYRTILIDGIRGSGKTALMLTLLAVTRAGKSKKGDFEMPGFDGAAYADLLPGEPLWRFAPPVDFDPLPEHIHVFPWLVYALHGLAEFATNSGRPPPGGEKRAKTILQQWRELYRQALLGWNASWDQHAMNRDIDEFVEIQRERARDWTGLVVAWRTFVDALLEALESAGTNGLPRGSLLVLPIDDMDLHPERAFDLLQSLRMCWHPRVVFLVTGRRESMLRLLADRLVGQARALARVTWADGFDDTRQKDSVRLARDMFVKTIPPRQVRRTKLVGLREYLVGRFDGKPGNWASIDKFLASWPTDHWPAQRQLFEVAMASDVGRSTLGFAMRDLIGHAGAAEGDTVRQLVALLATVQHDDFDEVRGKNVLSKIQVFAVPKTLPTKPGWYRVEDVRFLRADGTRSVDAEAEAILLAEFSALGDLESDRVDWDATMPVPTVAAMTRLPSGEDLHLTWPERLATRPTEVLAWLATPQDSQEDNGAATSTEESEKPLAIVVFERALAWASSAVEATGSGLGVPAWAWQTDPRRERVDLELSLWLAAPESGLTADDRHLLIVGAGLRLGGTDELASAEVNVARARQDRLGAAQRIGRLMPETRGFAWTRTAASDLATHIDRGAGEDDPWNLREFLIQQDWTEWNLEVRSRMAPSGVLGRRIASLLRVNYQRANNAGSRALVDLFTETHQGRQIALPSAIGFGRYLIKSDPKRRKALWNWLSELARLFPPESESMAGAAKLVGLWRAADAACGQLPLEMRLTDTGKAIAITVRGNTSAQVEIAVADRKSTLVAGRNVYGPGNWQISLGGSELEDPQWGIFLFAACTLNHEVGSPDPDVAVRGFDLLTAAGGAKVSVPAGTIGWRAAEQARLRWLRFINQIPSEEGRPELALQRWLVANAMQVVADSWWVDGSQSSSSQVPFPVEPSWFGQFANYRIDRKSSRASDGDQLADWAKSLDIRALTDPDCATAWDKYANPSTASTPAT